jgi:hypothetical protein
MSESASRQRRNKTIAPYDLRQVQVLDAIRVRAHTRTRNHGSLLYRISGG